MRTVPGESTIGESQRPGVVGIDVARELCVTHGRDAHVTFSKGGQQR